MQKKWKVIALSAIAATILALPAAAQIAPSSAFGSGALRSNTYNATAGLFKTDVDNYMDYQRYSRVLTGENKTFAFVTGGNYGLNAGFAHKLGDNYLGVWYQGNMFQQTASTETNTIYPVYDDITQTLTSKTTETSYSQGWMTPNNKIELLLGIADQGIKVGFYESLRANNHKGSSSRNPTVTDTMDGMIMYTNQVDEYSEWSGYMLPYLGWGTDIKISDSMRLRPNVDLQMTIYSDNKVDNYRHYTTLNGEKVYDHAYVGDGQNNGKLTPQGQIGVKLDLSHEGGKSSTLQLQYRFNTDIYSNSYEASGLSGDAVAGTVNWSGAWESDGYVNRKSEYTDRTVTETDIGLNINEQTAMTNWIRPSYQVTGKLGDLSLGFLAEVPVTITQRSQNQYWKGYHETKTVYNNADPSRNTTETWTKFSPSTNETATSILDVALDLGFGASYKLIADRLTVNAGIKATPTKFTNTVVTTTPRKNTVETNKVVDGNNTVISDTKDVMRVDPYGNNDGWEDVDSISVTNTWAGYDGSIRGGFTFFFTPAAALDMGLMVNTSVGNNFNVDLANLNVLFSFKF